MSDDRVGIQQSGAPTHQVDGETATNGAGLSAFRQKVATPDATQLLAEGVALMQALVCKTGQRDPVTEATRCTILSGTVNVTTCTTVTTVTALQNVVNVGGQPASNEYLIANRLLALQQIHFGIPVTLAMATTFNLRKLLHQKQPQAMCPVPSASAAGTLVCAASEEDPNQYALILASNTLAYLYSPFEDGMVLLPNPALSVALAAGTCAAWTPRGPEATATGGSTTTVNTNLTINRSLAGYKIRVTGGPGAGDERIIKSNTLGANSIIAVDGTTPFSATITASSTYQLRTGKWYVLEAGTLTTSHFKVYDLALNTWTATSITGLPATWGTSGKLVSTHSYSGDLATGVATAGGASTLTNTPKAWAANQFANQQVRIVSGAGAGQVKTIASNTGNVLTISGSWTINPDNTSNYVIEPNEDHLYLMGNNAVTMYRFNITALTWTTLAPGVARAVAPGAGLSGCLIEAQTDPDWNIENALLNGRRIYSFRGAAGGALDYYDIPSNAWTSNLAYAPGSGETFSAASAWVDLGGYLYGQKDSTGRWLRYSPSANEMIGVFFNGFTQGAAVEGNRVWGHVYTDGLTKVRWIYHWLSTSQAIFRFPII